MSLDSIASWVAHRGSATITLTLALGTALVALGVAWRFPRREPA